MIRAQAGLRHDAGPTHRVRRIGCVSFLNAKPLIEGLDTGDGPTVLLDVPSRLLSALESGDVDVALVPVIDYHRSRVPLMIVPVGGIGSEGVTLTVRLFAQKPIEELTSIYLDMDSHTSVTLLRILLWERGLAPRLIDYDAREQTADGRPVTDPEAMLLIGDKVVTDPLTAARATRYPHQIDLGEAWREWTGLPFVFAVWMARADADLGDLPTLLESTRMRNAGRIDQIVERHAEAHGWPRDLAAVYLGRLLQFRIEADQLRAIQRFADLAAKHGLIPAAQPLRLWSAATRDVSGRSLSP